MDDIVKAAMAKWPNVPHCYGWLALDARGAWRMRDAHAQANNLSGDKIHNAALNAFINRNYACDESGNWYFQNGPQKVYVDLEAAPYIVQLQADNTWRLHTDKAMPHVNAVYLDEASHLVFASEHALMQVDDRDLAQALDLLHCDEAELSDELLIAWMENKGVVANAPSIYFSFHDQRLPVTYSPLSELMKNFSYIAKPRLSSN
jgi:hypothetical protein